MRLIVYLIVVPISGSFQPFPIMFEGAYRSLPRLVFLCGRRDWEQTATGAVRLVPGKHDWEWLYQ